MFVGCNIIVSVISMDVLLLGLYLSCFHDCKFAYMKSGMCHLEFGQTLQNTQCISLTFEAYDDLFSFPFHREK